MKSFNETEEEYFKSISYTPADYRGDIPYTCKYLAIQYAKEVLKEAAEKAEAFISVDDTPKIIKSSILNIELK